MNVEKYRKVRERSVALTEPLENEDFVVQSMPDASPVKWHLAHTTWFFETFVLKPHASNYQTPNAAYAVLFNSYYNGVGEQFPRERRGVVSRPTVSQVLEWRALVDEKMLEVLESPSDEISMLVEIGLNHEEQHQELLLTDVKHALVENPAFEKYCERSKVSKPVEQTWLAIPSGISSVGYDGEAFHFDNEGPAHDTLIGDVSMSNRLVTNRDFIAFMEDGGYEQHDLWLSDGWYWVNDNDVRSPLYWHQRDQSWFVNCLSGTHPVELDAPVTHVSFFEADAYARWANARLPTEFEWEVFANHIDASWGTTMDDRECRPTAGIETASADSLFGSCWEWTSSAYRPYPGYRAVAGALGEYNGKFMNGLYVLKGGSCATPKEHIRPTYRNFFGPDKQWQFTGIRLAKDHG